MDKAGDPFVSAGKKILVTGGTGGVSLSSGKQFVVTQSKGTTIIQPAPAHSSTSSPQQHYVVTVGGNSTQSAGEHSGYASQAVQYVDASGRPVNAPETVVYTTNNQPAGANVQYQYASDSYHTAAASPYNYSSSNTTQFHTGAGEIVQHMGQTFFLQGGTMDGEGYPLTHTTRAAPATVKWLLENFEPCDGVSLPRSVLYNFYIHHCQTENVEPSNPASFGKLVRMIFRDLKTRRLGQRGNSRYHYYGIRLKPSSTLNQLMPDETPVAMRQPTHPQRRVVKSSTATDESESAPVTPKSEPGACGEPSTHIESTEDKHRQYLGSAVDAIPTDIKLVVDKHSMPEGITQHHLNVFSALYREHCEAILEIVINSQFNMIESLWQQFWRKPTSITPSLEGKLPKDRLFIISHMSEVQTYVKSMDYAFYQSLVEVLIPDVLRPIPASLTQAIRNFAKSLEGWLRSALVNAPEEILKTKLTALTAFSQTLRRYTSLNHLAQAARAVLVNSAQIQQMMADLTRVDFTHIQEQAAWVCQCADNIVDEIQADFKLFLQGEHSLEEWRDWLERVLNNVLEPYEGTENYSKAARYFLLKWSFYSSMVIRDLTLRSAASFGSFHLIRLLYDEYMFYLVEHKVAAATSRTPIAVMSELIENNDQLKLANQMKAAAQNAGGRPLTAVTLNSNNNNTPTGSKTVVLLPHGSTVPTAGGDGGPHAKRFKPENDDPLGIAVNALQ